MVQSRHLGRRDQNLYLNTIFILQTPPPKVEVALSLDPREAAGEDEVHANTIPQLSQEVIDLTTSPIKADPQDVVPTKEDVPHSYTPPTREPTS